VVTLYITSWQKGDGKTLLCAGLGKYLIGEGKKIGYLRTVMPDGHAEDARADATFMQQVLGLGESVQIIVTSREKAANEVKTACDKLSNGVDVVIVEGESSSEVIKMLNAKTIVVESYADKPGDINVYKEMGKNLLGVVLNKAPQNKIDNVSKEATARLNQADATLLGVLPEDRVLFAVTVGELTERIKGKILNSAEKSDELVESVMLGAMVVDHGPTYFGRKMNKAVVIRGDRPDMQLAALQTSTRCLILTGNIEPVQAVARQAEAGGVPVILTEGDTNSVAVEIEGVLSQTRFGQGKKMSRLTEIMGKQVNYSLLMQGMGLAS